MAVVGSRVTGDTTTKDTDKPNDAEARRNRWMAAVDKAESDLEKYWSRCDKIQKIYTEERKTQNTAQRKFSILWANVSTLQPATYARTPQPVVKRRFNDRDPLARAVSEITERSLEFQYDLSAFDETMRLVRDDFLLKARATAWVRYEPKFDRDEADEDIDQTSVPQKAKDNKARKDAKDDRKTEDRPKAQKIVDERVRLDFLNHRDFVHPLSRSWCELPWVARKVYLDRDRLKKRFKAVGAEVQLDHKPEGEKKEDESRDKATVYEIWDKETNKVYWIARGYSKGFLDEDDPPLQLAGFFPCPKPAFGTIATDTLIPIPDYVYYEDQAAEIDNVTDRIQKIISQLKLVGFYPSGGTEEGSTAIEQAFSGAENKLIPIPSMAAWSERGGVNAIQWVPIDAAVKVLRELFDVRARLIQDVYQITGISDIVRGASDPRETMGAQRIKAQWGSIRIRDRQLELVRFAADLTKLMAEVISDKFQQQTLLDMTGAAHRTDKEVEDEFKAAQAQHKLMVGQLVDRYRDEVRNYQAYMQANPGADQIPPDQGGPPPPPQQPQLPPEPVKSSEITIDAVVKLMRDDRMRTFRIDIETDSTIEADENENKQRMTELVTTVHGFLKEMIPAGRENPELIPFMGQLLTTTVRSHRVGRQLEGSIEDLMAQAEEQAERRKNTPPEPPPIPPEVQKAQLEMQASAQEFQMRFQAESQKFMAEMQFKMETHRDEMALREREAEGKLAMMQAEMEFKLRELSLREAEFTQKSQALQLDHSIKDRDVALKEGKTQVEIASQIGQNVIGDVAYIADTVRAMNENLNAPRALVRDETGRPVAVVVNGVERPVVRDETGNVVGLE